MDEVVIKFLTGCLIVGCLSCRYRNFEDYVPGSGNWFYKLYKLYELYELYNFTNNGCEIW
jgi:hypothetical protein